MGCGAQGIQSFTEACARLELGQQRDSLLRNLNHLCISIDDSDVLSDDGSTATGVLPAATVTIIVTIHTTGPCIHA